MDQYGQFPEEDLFIDEREEEAESPVRCYLRQGAWERAGIPCRECSASGLYVDYGGYLVGGVSVPCPHCKGTGWIGEEPDHE